MSEKEMLGTVSERRVAPVKMAKRKMILLAMMIFILTAGLAVLCNSTIWGYGLHLEYSISRYVGLEAWSSVMFTLGNIIVAGCIASYLYYLAEIWRLPRWFYWLVIVMVVMLLALSFCPVCLFDPAPGVKSVPTFIHEVSSRTMFLAMLLAAIVFMVCGRVHGQARRQSLYFATFGVICVCGYLSGMDWFLNLVLIFETTYLLWFMFLCLICRSKGQQWSWERRNSHEREEIE